MIYLQTRMQVKFKSPYLCAKMNGLLAKWCKYSIFAFEKWGRENGLSFWRD